LRKRERISFPGMERASEGDARGLGRGGDPPRSIEKNLFFRICAIYQSRAKELHRKKRKTLGVYGLCISIFKKKTPLKTGKKKNIVHMEDALF